MVACGNRMTMDARGIQFSTGSLHSLSARSQSLLLIRILFTWLVAKVCNGPICRLEMESTNPQTPALRGFTLVCETDNKSRRWLLILAIPRGCLLQCWAILMERIQSAAFFDPRTALQP